MSEADGGEGVDLFKVDIDVHSKRYSEIVHEVQFIVTSTKGATVEPSNVPPIPSFDALFGERVEDHPLEDSRILPIQSLQLGSDFFVTVRNDFEAESMECFTLLILRPDVLLDRNIIVCNSDENATDYFCRHTLCIEDDDGL